MESKLSSVPRKNKRVTREGKILFLCIVPFLILVFLFSYFPLHGWIYSLYDYKPALGLARSEFVGFKWFRLLVSSPTQVDQIVQVMKNTFAMSFLGIATSILPVGFAILLNEIKCKWFKNLVQTLTTLPNFISWVLVYTIAFSLFSSTGLVNTLLQEWGFVTDPVKFLDSGNHTWLMMCLWNIWKGLGWGAIMYLAGISGIDPELYESARIDGANRFHLMRHITLPALMPTFLVMLMLSIANLLNNGMDQYFVFQNAFNRNTIQVLDLYVYNLGMGGNSLSLATAISMLKSVISVALLAIVNIASKKIRGISIIYKRRISMELSISEKKKAKKVRKRENLTFSILNYTFFFLITLICAYPFYYLIINSISNNELSALGQIRFFPQEIHFENYSQVLQLKGLPLAATVSVARTVIGTAATVLASAFLGFMFTQEKMWKRKFWYRFVVITMYFNAGLIPLFITMKTLGLTNNFWVYILPAVVQPFNIILVKTYIESIPKSLQEAAEMDGAGIIQVFFRVILPNCTPILATVAIFSAVGQWNSFQDTLIYITDQSLYSLQYLLYTYINQANSLAQMVKNTSGSLSSIASAATTQTPTSIRMTVSVIVVLPIMFIYPLFQKYFVKGIMLGAVKG